MKHRAIPYIEKCWRDFRTNNINDLESILKEWKGSVNSSALTYSWNEQEIRETKNYCSLPSSIAHLSLSKKLEMENPIIIQIINKISDEDIVQNGETIQLTFKKEFYAKLNDKEREKLRTLSISEKDKLFHWIWKRKNNNEPDPLLSYYAFALSFFANYRRTKIIWNIDNDFEQSIQELPFPNDVPVSALRYLPSDTIIIPIYLKTKEGEWDGNLGEYNMCCWYDWDINENAKPELYLRFGFFSEKNTNDQTDNNIFKKERNFTRCNLGELLPAFAINLSKQQTLNDAFQEAIKYENSLARRNSRILPNHIIQEFKTIVNILLYASGCDDIVKQIGHEYIPPNKKLLKRQNEKNKKSEKQDFADPIEYQVGVKFGKAIRQYKEYVAKEEYEAIKTGRTVRPHVRKSHSHLFWTGKDRKIPRVLFLAPIAVKMKDIKEEAEYNLIRKVE